MKEFTNINLKYISGGSIALVTMANPKEMNALSNVTLDSLDEIIEDIESNQLCKGIIITGEGKSFVAGANIKEMENYKWNEGRDYANKAQMIFSKIENLEKPVIAAVNGYALGGGCELAMSCDIRIASDKALFGQPEVNLGLIPCFGGTQRLPRLVGVGIAKELIYTARNVKPEEALRIGLVNKVVDSEKLIEEAVSMLNIIISKAPVAVSLAKRAINEGINLDLNRGLELEKDIAAIVFASEDKDIGVKAFIEKETPKFINK